MAPLITVPARTAPIQSVQPSQPSQQSVAETFGAGRREAAVGGRAFEEVLREAQRPRERVTDRAVSTQSPGERAADLVPRQEQSVAERPAEAHPAAEGSAEQHAVPSEAATPEGGEASPDTGAGTVNETQVEGAPVAAEADAAGAAPEAAEPAQPTGAAVEMVDAKAAAGQQTILGAQGVVEAAGSPTKGAADAAVSAQTASMAPASQQNVASVLDGAMPTSGAAIETASVQGVPVRTLVDAGPVAQQRAGEADQRRSVADAAALSARLADGSDVDGAGGSGGASAVVDPLRQTGATSVFAPIVETATSGAGSGAGLGAASGTTSGTTSGAAAGSAAGAAVVTGSLSSGADSADGEGSAMQQETGAEAQRQAQQMTPPVTGASGGGEQASEDRAAETRSERGSAEVKAGPAPGAEKAAVSSLSPVQEKVFELRSVPMVAEQSGDAKAEPGAARLKAFEVAASRGLSAALQQREGSITVRLTPETIGSLKIDLTVRNGVVSVNFQTGTDEARQLLMQTMGQLREAIQGRGLTVERLETSTNPALAPQRVEAQQQTAQRQADQQQDARRDESQQQRHDAGDGRSKGSFDDQQRGDERSADGRRAYGMNGNASGGFRSMLELSLNAVA